MFGRSLFDVVETFKSRMLQAWTAGWSVPTDEVFVPARLPRRYAGTTSPMAERWLSRTARSAAVKWRDEVCGVRAGRVRSVALAGAGVPQVLPVKVPRVLHVTARYCGRIRGGGFCFRHGLCDTRGIELLHFISQIHFDPPPELPAYPGIQVELSELFEEDYQIFQESTVANSALKGIAAPKNRAEFGKPADHPVRLPQSL